MACDDAMMRCLCVGIKGKVYVENHRAEADKVWPCNVTNTVIKKILLDLFELGKSLYLSRQEDRRPKCECGSCGEAKCVCRRQGRWVSEVSIDRTQTHKRKRRNHGWLVSSLRMSLSRSGIYTAHQQSHR